MYIWQEAIFYQAPFYATSVCLSNNYYHHENVSFWILSVKLLLNLFLSEMIEILLSTFFLGNTKTLLILIWFFHKDLHTSIGIPSCIIVYPLTIICQSFSCCLIGHLLLVLLFVRISVCGSYFHVF